MNYSELIQVVKKIDPDAAIYMDNEARYLDSFCIDVCGSLLGNFIWSETPQGSAFWVDINDRVYLDSHK
jgi:hypothetical protein